jgi:Serine dehydrogenase proteinase
MTMSKGTKNTDDDYIPETGLVGPTDIPEELTPAERAAAIEAGGLFAEAVANGTGGQQAPCLAIVGQFPPLGNDHKLTELRVLEACTDAFGYPGEQIEIMNILLDSPGGSLDSAFKAVRYLSCYARELNLYVPRRAKSASTLLALGATRIFLSRFAELGPLDTQIFDPRNPVAYVSALDCYQSVDHVRQFGITTMSEALKQLSADAGVQVPLADLLGTASAFAIGAIDPMLRGIRALDFGAWGRSLKIGEKYAHMLLRDHHPKEAEKIAARLVYDYTHHLFPIDYREASDIGLDVALMGENIYHHGLKVLQACGEKVFVGFVSPAEADKQPEAEERRAMASGEPVSRATGEPRPTPDGHRRAVPVGQRGRSRLPEAGS